MLNLNAKHSLAKTNISKTNIKKITEMPLPSFVAHKLDTQYIKQKLKKYSHFKNLIVIGNGGSNTSFKAFYTAIAEYRTKKAEILTTMEPDRIGDLKRNYSKKDTLIIPVSKSGTNVGVLEAMFSFMKDSYTILPVTAGGALQEIIYAKNMDFIAHPADVGGRYSGRTTSAMTPSVFCNINVAEVNKGAIRMYKDCGPKKPVEENPALKLATILYNLEKKGYNEVFVPIYSTRLAGFLPLIIQLMHESVCKGGKGQTFFGDVAPESQHHTNQRFFGGKRNAIGLFVVVENQDNKTARVNIPKKLHKIKLRSGKLNDITNIPYEKDLHFEFQGTYKDAINNKIPAIVVSIDRISPKAVGEFLAFWQYVAVYSSMLRGVNPYDQPQVEASKEISFNLRKQFGK